MNEEQTSKYMQMLKEKWGKNCSCLIHSNAVCKTIVLPYFKTHGHMAILVKKLYLAFACVCRHK